MSDERMQVCAGGMHREGCPHAVWSEAALRADSLDAAWAEAEAALPKGRNWFEVWSRDAAFGDPPESRYWAEAHLMDTGRDIDGHGPTPAAALRALAVELAKLRR